jgi:hypothetical protein
MRLIENFGAAPVHVSRGTCCNRWNPDDRQNREQGGGIPAWAMSLYDGGGAGANWGSDGMFGGGDMSANTGGKGEYYDLWNSIRDMTPGGLLSDHYGWSAEYGGAPGGRLDADLFQNFNGGGSRIISATGGAVTPCGGSVLTNGAAAALAVDWWGWLWLLVALFVVLHLVGGLKVRKLKLAKW